MGRPLPVMLVGGVVVVIVAAFAALALWPEPAKRPAPHGLSIRAAASEPHGAPVRVAYALEDGEAWEATLYLEARQARPVRASSRSTIDVRQVFHAGAPAHTTTELRYVRVESSQGAAEPPPGVTEGSFEHAANGRPRPETRELTGKNIALADTLYGSMMLAGLAGSGAWIPDRAFQEGESWPAEDVLTPRMVAILLQQQRQADAAIPMPVFRGTVHAERVERDGAGGGRAVLTIQAMVEVEGPMVRGRERGAIDMGYRVQGTATIDLRTGLPLSIDARASQRMSFEGPGESHDQSLELVLRAEAHRRGG